MNTILVIFVLIYILFTEQSNCFTSENVGSIEALKLTMPPRPTTKLDTYLCTAFEMPSEPFRITTIEPHSDQQIAHHMLLFGCTEPKESDSVWECMHTPICKGQDENILYGWGKNAPKLELPDDVGMTVGGNVNEYLVLQVHYLDIRPDDDESGITIQLSKISTEFTASILTYAPDFEIQPAKKSHLVNTECCYNGFEPITSFAFRVHTHVMGKRVYMTKKTDEDVSEIASRDPQLPQAFVPAERTIINPGDKLKLTCDFDSSNKTHVVRAGHTHDSEMCNIYLMVYSRLPHIYTCTDDDQIMIDDKNPGNLNHQSKLIEETNYKYFLNPSSYYPIEIHYGFITSVAIGPDGSLWVLHRHDRMWFNYTFSEANVINYIDYIDINVIYNVDPDTQKVKATFGKNLFMLPHMIHVDYDNNIWVTDVGKHQVLKFNADGKLLMTLGIEFESGSDNEHLCQPTDVVILNNGHILVSDGYCNSRIMIYDKNGNYIDKIEDRDFDIVHSIVYDECNDVLYIANRLKKEITLYQLETKGLIGSLSLDDYVYALTKGPYGNIIALVTDGESKTEILKIDIDREYPIIGRWKIHNVVGHDIAFGAASKEYTGVGQRLFAIYIASTELQAVKSYLFIPPNFLDDKEMKDIKDIKHSKIVDKNAKIFDNKDKMYDYFDDSIEWKKNEIKSNKLAMNVFAYQTENSGLQMFMLIVLCFACFFIWYKFVFKR